MSSALQNLADLLDQSIVNDASVDLSSDGFIKDGYDEKVDEYRGLTKHGKDYLAKLQNDEIEKTGIQSLKIKSNKVFGYFFEVPAGQANKVPEYFIRKQTLTNAERFITPELKEYEEKVFSAEEKLIRREQEIFAEIQAEVLKYTSEIQDAAAAIAELDLIFSFTKSSRKQRFCRPRFSKDKKLIVKKGRHSVVEVLGEKHGGERFVPNDIDMDAKTTFSLVTGPNMSGKSTFLRQNALIVLLAHIGSFVPAESAEIPLIDRIFTRIGSGDILAKGQSTFLVEMQEAAHILRNATAESFVILDEIGRGTSTFDGLSLAWAITEFLERKGIKTLFATHYHELIDLTDSLSKGNNLSVAVLENEQGVTFLHRIAEGGASKSFGIEVAELAGMPGGVTKRAGEILMKLEKEEITLERNKKQEVRSKDPNQQDLFDLPKEEKQDLSIVEKELLKLNPDEMTPMEALQRVVELRKKVEEG